MLGFLGVELCTSHAAFLLYIQLYAPGDEQHCCRCAANLLLHVGCSTDSSVCFALLHANSLKCATDTCCNIVCCVQCHAFTQALLQLQRALHFVSLAMQAATQAPP